MNEEQMKGYLAYWDDDSYPEIWDLPRVYNPMTCLYNKFNKDWQLGWAVASNENQHGEYQEYEISEATGGIIHKKGRSVLEKNSSRSS